MGNIIYYKGILLDERDFGGQPHPCMETLSATIHDYLLDEFEVEFDDGLPELEMVGLASERFKASHMFYEGFGYGHRSNWVTQEGDFRSALLRDFDHLDLPEPEAILQADRGTIEELELQFQRRIHEEVAAERYGCADQLLKAIASIRETGLPRVQDEWDFDQGAVEEIYDFRVANYGPGSRVLAEVSFNWGQ